MRYVKDPGTGKRVSRPNPSDEWVVIDVPEQRIVADALWDAVKARQTHTRHTVRGSERRNRFGDARRPKHLFSGLLKCGCCGASYTLMNSFTRYGCAARRNKGTCNNRALIRREEVEARVLGGLKDQLLHPDLIAEFIAEYQREYNRLMQSERADRTRLEKELSQVTGQIDRIVDAVANGMFHDSMRDKLTGLEEQQGRVGSAACRVGGRRACAAAPEAGGALPGEGRRSCPRR